MPWGVHLLDAARAIRLNEHTARVHACASVDEAARAAVATLRELIHCDWAGVVLHTASFPACRHVWSDGGVDLDALADDTERMRDHSALYGAQLRRVVDRPASYGEFVADADLGASGFHRDCLRPHGAHRLMHYATPGSVNYALICARGGGADFGVGDSLVMHAVGRHLDAATRGLARAAGGRVTLGGRMLALQGFSWLVFGDDGRVLRSSETSRAGLRSLDPDAAARDVVPDAWRERSARRGAGAPPAPFVGRGAEGRVSAYVAPIRTAPGEHTAVFLVDPDPAGDPWRQAGLTARESEVLGWVASGGSNAQIAARLGLSPLTVKSHVERVLEKLDLPNRAAAAAWAIETMGR